MATHSKFIQSESEFQIVNGRIIEGASLGTNVVAKMNKSTGNLEVTNINETYNSLDAIGWHVNDQGYRWWSNPANQTFGTENTGGSGNWGVYKQSNIYTTARKYAGKDSLYGVHIYREPNISSSSTWGGLSLYPPAEAKLRGHKYRLSFDYRGYSNGNGLAVYQNYTVGWGDMGIGLPTPWSAYAPAFDTDWQWQRYEYDFEIQDQYLDFMPGSNRPAWDPNTQYTGTYYAVTYNGYVYAHRAGSPDPTRGVPPEEEYPNVWVWKVPMTPGYFDLYRNIKIGFNYETQGSRGTHVYVDNIQLTDITTNQRWKFNGDGWEADNISDATLHIKAVGTALHSLFQNGDTSQPDIFAVHGNRVLEINGEQVYSAGGRGLRLTTFGTDGKVTSDILYDTYGDAIARDKLAQDLSNFQNIYWTLTSYDAISNANGGTNLHAQLTAMGSKMWDVNDPLYYVGYYRSTYAAVGYGQNLIKEDGAKYDDQVYKRKAVIDLKL